MTFTEIFQSEELTGAEKVEKIKDLVAGIRSKYGNEKEEVPSTKVCTSEGYTDIKYLSNDDKVAIAERRVSHIRNEAIAYVEETPGAVLDKTIEAMVAVDSVLVNLAAKSESAYI